MATCLRCGAGNEWIQGKVKDEPALSQQEGWISVKERFPDHMVTVLAFIQEIIPGEGFFVDTVSYNDERKVWLFALGSDDVEVNVTHWMPLPNPPAAREDV